MEFSIKAVLHEWIRRIWIIAICTVFAAIGSFFYTKYNTTPVYTTTMKVTTFSEIRNDEASATAGNYINNMTLAYRRVQMYFELLKTTSFYQQVSDTSGTGYYAGSVGGMLSFREVEDMGFFYVTVTGIDPVAVDRIAQAVEENMDPYLDSLLKDASVSVLEPHYYPYASAVPLKNSAVKGGLIGAVLAMGVLALISMFDTHIKDEETLLKRYDIPILGTIPDFTAVTNKKHK